MKKKGTFCTATLQLQSFSYMFWVYPYQVLSYLFRLLPKIGQDLELRIKSCIRQFSVTSYGGTEKDCKTSIIKNFASEVP